MSMEKCIFSLWAFIPTTIQMMEGECIIGGKVWAIGFVTNFSSMVMINHTILNIKIHSYFSSHGWSKIFKKMYILIVNHYSLTKKNNYKSLFKYVKHHFTYPKSISPLEVLLESLLWCLYILLAKFGSF